VYALFCFFTIPVHSCVPYSPFLAVSVCLWLHVTCRAAHFQLAKTGVRITLRIRYRYPPFPCATISSLPFRKHIDAMVGRSEESLGAILSIRPCRTQCVLCLFLFPHHNKVVAILYLHRSHFALIRGDPDHESYTGRSVWAVYRSSARTIRGMHSLYARHMKITGKMWYLWSAYYSACVSSFPCSYRFALNNFPDCNRLSCSRQTLVSTIATCSRCHGASHGGVRARLEVIFDPFYACESSIHVHLITVLMFFTAHIEKSGRQKSERPLGISTIR
jgi:hypothetical protein